MSGIGASPGISVGRAVVLDRSRASFRKAPIKKAKVTAEIARFRGAVDASVKQLQKLQRSVEGTAASEHVKIIEAHELMLQDDLLVQGTEDLIKQELINAEWALHRSLASIKEFFNQLEDEHFRARQTDVETVGDRILRNLTGQHAESLMEVLAKSKEPTVLVARLLTPADTIQLHHSEVVGICTDEGTKTTHMAIVARSLELPAVVGAVGVTSEVKRGDNIVIDGDSGQLCIRPTRRQLDAYMRRHRKVSAVRTKLSKRRKKRAITLDGFEIQLSGNIDLIDEIAAVHSRGGHGIGLYRTEYLFLQKQNIATEQEQYQAYKQVLKRASPAPATIRTLDIGGDKLNLPGDAVTEALDPFFGLRAIRYCLVEQSLFRTQLRALLRASVHGQLRLLIPFVTDVTEIRQVKVMIEDVKRELRQEGAAYSSDIDLGVMIEIPSAALTADLLAREVDFFSVGTNDLIQYTLAISRDSTACGHLYHPLHPSVLRILRIISDAAHNEGIHLSMCGEMAGEALYTAVLLGLRFQELSMNPRSIPVVREIVQRMRLGEARHLVDRLAPLATWKTVENEVATYMLSKFPDLAPLLGSDLIEP